MLVCRYRPLVEIRGRIDRRRGRWWRVLDGVLGDGGEGEFGEGAGEHGLGGVVGEGGGGGEGEAAAGEGEGGCHFRCGGGGWVEVEVGGRWVVRFGVVDGDE